MSKSKKLHLHGPKLSKYVDHQVEITHRPQSLYQPYECRCITCGDIHVKWSSETEYYWFMLRKDRAQRTSFRQLFWAPRYCDEFQQVTIAISEIDDNKRLTKQGPLQNAL